MKIIFRKNTVFIMLFASLIIFQALSCKKFLHVQPRDYMFEEEAFSTKKSVESVLNGVYKSLADSMSYGNALSINATEQMAQYYYSHGADYRNLFTEYTYIFMKPYFGKIWSTAYRSILGVNNFCTRLEDPAFKVLEPTERDILLGEGYAIRAFLHFDQLRLFGPVYLLKPDVAAIPYVRKPNTEPQPMLSAKKVVEQILLDLDAALILLEKDPVRTKGANKITIPGIGESIDFLSNRHRRMNYFAVKTLQARVLLYAGKKTEALASAKSVILEQEAFFSWQTEQQMSIDPLLTGESFFGIENKKIYDYYRVLFSPLLKDEKIITTKPARLDELYNPLSNDLRLKYWFKVGLEGDKTYKVFVKFNNVTISDQSIRYYQPLIRKSELYLIAAESEPELQQGYFYLNSLRVIRGLPPVDYQVGNTANDLITAIREEYQREFIGEGQTFFMFKRFNASSISNADGTGRKNMDESMYVVPLPEDEVYYR